MDEMEMKKKNPKWLPIVLGLAGAAVVAVIVAVLFVTGVLGASPAKKYAKIQEQYLTAFVDKSVGLLAEAETKQNDTENTKEDLAQKYGMKLALSDEAANLLGMEKGLNVELSGKAFLSQKDQNVRVLTDYILNGNRLFGSDLYLAVQDYIFFLGIPELSEEYLSMDFQEMIEELVKENPALSGEQALLSGAKQELLPAEEVQNILNGMKDIWLKYSPENVTREKNAAIEKNGITVNADRYTASYTKGDVYDCMNEMIHFLKGQKALEKYVVKTAGITAEEYEQGFDDMAAELAVQEADREAEALKVELGAAKTGIYSLELSVPESRLVVAGIWNNQKEEKESAWVMTAADDKMEFRNKAAKAAEGWEGTLSVDAETADGDDFDMELAYDGVAYDEKAKTVKFHAVFNSSLLSGMGFGVTVDSAEEKQDVTIELLLGNLSMGSLKITSEKTDFEAISFPDQSYDLEDEEQITEYLSGSDFVEFFGNLSANEDLAGLLEQFGVQDMFGNIGGSGADEGLDGGDAADDWGEATDFTGFTGYEVDEDGWVSFTADEAEVMAAGVGSTGCDSFEGLVLTEGRLNTVADLLERAYEGRQTYEGDYTSYAIYGYEPYVASYYTTLLSWYDSADEYYTNFNLSVDAVTGELQYMEIYNPDMEKGFALAADMAENILGADRNELKTVYEQAVEEGSDYASVNGINMFWYDMDDYFTFYLSPSYE